MIITNAVEPIKTMNVKSAFPRKVILWGGDDLLSHAVALFLQKSQIIDVIQVSRDVGVENLIETMQKITPEVIFLCLNTVDEYPTLPLRLINEQVCLQVVTVGLESNLMQVYSKHNIHLKGASELLSIVESGNFPICTSGKEVDVKKQVQ